MAKGLLGSLLTGGASWGDRPEDRAWSYPCDAIAAGPVEVLYRAVDVAAPAGHVYRWLCQLAVAPYSYDLLDNRGRRSPRTLTPGADELRIGQRVATIFRLESWSPGEQLTLRMHDPAAVRVFDDVVLTYAVRPAGERRSRIVVKLLLPRRPGRVRAVWRRLLTLGDVVMMRKQLRTLGRLAETTQPLT